MTTYSVDSPNTQLDATDVTRIMNAIGAVLAASTTYADDAAAAIGGVAVGSLYRTVSAVKVRVA